MSNVLQHYKNLHQIPELGHQEYKTSAYLAEHLGKYGYHITKNIGNSTGLIGSYDTGKTGPVLALRADMDALGSICDGAIQANHTCGHDAHCSMLLSAAEEILQKKILSKGTLKIFFQPAEELGTGAMSMIEAGALEDIDIILGQHLRPIQEIPAGVATPAVYYSSSSRIYAKIIGETAHGARPHLGVNAIDAAAAAVVAVQMIQMDPNQPCSAKATRFLCDTSVTNVIPNEANVVWDLRAQNNETMDILCNKVQKAIQQGSAIVGASAETKIVNPLPAAVFDKNIIELLEESIVDVLGENGLHPPIYTPGGEDFNFFKKYKPSIQAGFFGLGCNLEPGLHHPDMHFELAALENGKNILISAVKKILG